MFLYCTLSECVYTHFFMIEILHVILFQQFLLTCRRVFFICELVSKSNYDYITDFSIMRKSKVHIFSQILNKSDAYTYFRVKITICTTRMTPHHRLINEVNDSKGIKTNLFI